jgi:hypothetical protein
VSDELTDFDGCSHGVSYDTDCAGCDADEAEATAAGAFTPNEIGIYFRGKRAGQARAEAALTHIEELAKVQAVACQRAHRADHARNWLDVLAIIERAPRGES